MNYIESKASSFTATRIEVKAQKLLDEKRYEAAAELLANSKNSFEANVMKFIKDDREYRKGLKRFLELTLQKNLENKMLCECIVFWLLDTLMIELSEAKRRVQPNGEKRSPSRVDNERADLGLTDMEPEQRTREIIRQFLARDVVLECVRNNVSAAYRLIAKHFDYRTQLELATVLNDIHTRIKTLILLQDWKSVLNLLKEKRNTKLFYDYVSLLFKRMPRKVVQLLIEHNDILEVDRLLPAFDCCFESHNKSNKPLGSNDTDLIDSVFFYFDAVLVAKPSVRIGRDAFDFGVRLYVTFKPDQLLQFLRSFGNTRSSMPYDFDCALRLCLDKGLNECVAFLYAADRQYYQAVTYALKVGVDLARQYANDMSNFANGLVDEFYCDFNNDDVTEEHQRRVWKMISNYIIDRDQCSTSTMEMERRSPKPETLALCEEIMEESKHVLRISDVVEHYAPFTSIMPFRDSILRELKRNTDAIKESEQKINEIIKATQDISEQAQSKQKEIISVSADEKCTICKKELKNSRFVAFICRHSIHFRCLERYLFNNFYSTNDKATYCQMIEREKALMQKMESIPQNLTNAISYQKVEEELKAVKAKIQNMLTSSCPRCGQRCIETIDKPLILEEERENELALWDF